MYGSVYTVAADRKKGNGMKRILTVFLGLVMILGSLTGCSGSTPVDVVKASSAQMELNQTQETVSQSNGTVISEDENGKTKLPLSFEAGVDIEKGIRIAVVAKSTEGNYWKQMKKYMKEAVNYINSFYGLEGEDAVQMTFEGPDSDTKIDDQINTIDAVLAENPSVLCLAAIDMNSCQAQMETAQDNGIPVVLFHSKVKHDMSTVLCATNNCLAGAEAARQLSWAIGEKGKTVIFHHGDYDQAGRSRVKGFKEEISRNHKNVKVAEYAQDQEENIEDTIRSVLEKKRTKGIFCTSQALAEKVLTVMKDYPDKEIAFVGFDAGKMQIDAVREGKELGTVVQNIPLMACQTIQSAVIAASPDYTGQLEKDIKVEYTWVDSENLDKAKQEGLLYE